MATRHPPPRDNESMAKCLYCVSEADTHEHVIPAAFGEFKDGPRLQAPVCSEHAIANVFGAYWMSRWRDAVPKDLCVNSTA